MVNVAFELGNQTQEELEYSENIDLIRYDSLLIMGMGGSGVAGDVLSLLSNEVASKNIIVRKSYSVPKKIMEVNPFCLFISYSGNTEETLSGVKDAIKNNPPVVHPVIRTHPITKRKAIFVNPLFTTKINELSKSESDALLEFLYSYSITPEFTCRFSWTPNSIAIWDNRCTLHKPINDYFPEHRLLERITVDGDEPF